MRLLGINIPDEKRIEVALTYIYGIGQSAARRIINLTKVDPNKRAKNLTTEELNRIKEIIEKNYITEGELRRNIQSHIKRLIEIQSYQGLRHVRHLPVRGQRTRTNSRTVRGNVRKTVGSGKRKTELK